MDISYSDGSTVKDAVIQVWEDNHTERAGFFRAFWTDGPNGISGSPVIGYCSPGGSHKTIGAVVSEVRRLGHTESIYRNGRKVSP